MKKQTAIILVLICLTTLPFLFLAKDINSSLIDKSLIIGNICAYIGAILIFWQFILSIRFIVNLFTEDLASVIKTHKLLGKYGVLFILIHLALVLYSYMKNVFWLFVPNFSTQKEIFIDFGRISFLLICIIWITSIIFYKKMQFRYWQYIHYISYIALFLVFLHPLTIGTFIKQNEWLYYLWIFLFSGYITIFILRIIIFLGFFDFVYKIIDIKKVNDILIITLMPNNSNDYFLKKGGQYCYFKLSIIGEAHPFSILEFNKKTGELVFGIKIVGNFTKQLNNLKIGDKTYLQGPYGTFTQQGFNNDYKVILSGGIGITPFFELVKQYSNKNLKCVDCFVLASNKCLQNAIYRDKFKRILSNNYYDFITKEKILKDICFKENIINQRIDKQNIQKILGKDLQKFKFFICGNKSFIQGMEKILKDLNIKENKIFTEKFF